MVARDPYRTNLVFRSNYLFLIWESPITPRMTEVEPIGWTGLGRN